MNNQTIDGTLRDVAGRVEGAAGALSDNAKLELSGKAKQIVGKAQAAAGDTVDAVRDLTSDRPVSTLLITAGLAFLLGVFWSRNRD